MNLTNAERKQTVAMTPEVAAALAQMDEAYQKASEGLSNLDADWEFVALGLRTEVILQVKKAMSELKVNQTDLAKKMGVSRAQISKILNEDECNVQLDTIAKLAVALERDIALRLIQKTEEVVVQPSVLPECALEQFGMALTMIQKSNYSFTPGQYPNITHCLRQADIAVEANLLEEVA